MPGQRLAQLLLGAGQPAIPVGSQYFGSPFTLENRRDDRPSGDADQVGDDLVYADIHLIQGFLHAADFIRLELDQLQPQAPEGAQWENLQNLKTLDRSVSKHLTAQSQIT
jgi:hypothetical protein